MVKRFVYTGHCNIEVPDDNFGSFVYYVRAFLPTLCIILSCRNLPSKDPEEAERHKQQYEAMVEAAKRKGKCHYIAPDLICVSFIVYMQTISTQEKSQPLGSVGCASH